LLNLVSGHPLRGCYLGRRRKRSACRVLRANGTPQRVETAGEFSSEALSELIESVPEKRLGCPGLRRCDTRGAGADDCGAFGCVHDGAAPLRRASGCSEPTTGDSETLANWRNQDGWAAAAEERMVDLQVLSSLRCLCSARRCPPLRAGRMHVARRNEASD
jgi:hypothetical protein